MRFRHRDGTVVHLAYCTNVHQAEDLDGVLDQLARYAEPVRERLGAGSLGLGLWLARDVVSALVQDAAAVARLRAELATRGLEVVTLNGFPYRGFHAPIVKKAVYVPDWSDPARLGYTVDLARLLARLLPEDAARGSVSTLPLGWRHPWPPERREAARGHIAALAGELATIAGAQGRPVRVGFEPEPGCVVETTGDAATHLAGVDTRWLGVCLDACHLAVAFEEPGAALERLAAAGPDGGLPVVKTQASCALHVADPTAVRAELAAVAEPRFLHQVRERHEAPGDATDAHAPDNRAGGDPAGRPLAADDLDEALERLPGAAPWRVHFHVPVHRAALDRLTTTQAELTATLRALLGGPRARTDHVEVETYTWSVLPTSARARDGVGSADREPGADAVRDPVRDLVGGLAAELDWTREQLLALGLTEVK
jgi:sugar phosphate isomerase/epimerase